MVEVVGHNSRRRSGTMLCYVRDMGKEEQKRYMQEQIIDQYVYKKCDFFLCLDGDTGYYEILQKMTAVFRDRCTFRKL